MARGQHPPACARRWRDHAATHHWTTWRTAQAIHGCCTVSLLKAHRLALGWSIRKAVEELQQLCSDQGLGQPHVNEDLLSVWENGRGRPRPQTIDLLARLYRANAVRLGFAGDYTEDNDGAKPVVVIPTHPTTIGEATQTGPDGGPRNTVVLPGSRDTAGPGTPPPGAGGEGDEQMERRVLFHQVLAGAGLALSGRFLAAVEKTRQDMDRTHTFLGDAKRAASVQAQALALYPRGFATIDPTLICLDQATCMVAGNAIVDACQLAEDAIAGLPAQHRTPIVLTRAHDLLTAIPPARRDLKAAQNFREALALEAPSR